MSKQIHSLYGRKVGVDSSGALVVPGGVVSGRGRGMSAGDASRVVLFDDFLGDAIDARWNVVLGSDASSNVASGAVVAGAAGGVLRLAAADSAGTMVADGAQITSFLNWKAANGSLVFEARVALAEITNVSAFIGFTGVITLEAPIISAASADTLTTNATDAVGFMFDTAMAADTWWLTGVANNVDATAQNTGIAPVAATYETLRVELTATGEALFYRNGALVGTQMTGAVTPSVALTPTLGLFPRTAAFGKQLDVDYVYAAMTR